MTYNKEWHKEYYLNNREEKIKYNHDKYHESHDIKPRGFSEEQFQQRLKENYKNKIETLTPHINSKSKIKVRCNDCGYEWQTTSQSLLRGQGCKLCHTLSQRKGKDKFLEEFTKNYNTKYELLSDYVNANTKVKVKCNLCDNIWFSKPYHLSHTKCGCPICANKERVLKTTKSQEKFIDDVYHKYNDRYTVVGQYMNAKTKLEIRCNNCNNIWKIVPYSLLQNTGCPICNQSKGENLILKFLETNNILYNSQYVFNDCKNKYVLHFDFYLPELNICVEYDGIQHFKSIEFFGGEEALKYTKNNDKIKNKYCQENNIKLIRIPYNNIESINEILTKLIF